MTHKTAALKNNGLRAKKGAAYFSGRVFQWRNSAFQDEILGMVILSKEMLREFGSLGKGGKGSGGKPPGSC